MKKEKNQIGPHIESLIHELRGQKIILDSDLARIYGIATKSLNRAVKRTL
ncbi:MAG TPA: ORF6N domain-containing protein [Candidatus Limnocylindrales bacterium]|nr:ORF6N domain-containing protein [Candidatus Limnocylindrales bacterium]